MFIGEYQHSFDTKGRVAVPAKFRSGLSGGAIVTKGLDRCLFVFSSESWKDFAKELATLPLNRSNPRSYARFFFSGATDVKLDGQGRILIPENLRSFAGIDKQVVVTGLYNRIEIWDEKSWEKYRKDNEGAAEEIAEQLGELGN